MPHTPDDDTLIRAVAAREALSRGKGSAGEQSPARPSAASSRPGDASAGDAQANVRPPEAASRGEATSRPDAPRRAVVLLSGGLDSATTLAVARSQDFECYALSVEYGQRHSAELGAAVKVARSLGAREHRVMRVDLAGIGGSALTDASLAVPEEATTGIPVTYVPARNTMMLSLALAWAEVLGARDIFMGVNAIDYSGYPDCRPEFVEAFEQLATRATKAGAEGASFRVHAPLIRLSKAEIVRLGTRLGVDFSTTVSCYQADSQGRACGRCDSCRIRRAGFESAGIPDPTRYAL